MSLLKPYLSNGTYHTAVRYSHHYWSLDYIDGDPVYMVGRLLNCRTTEKGDGRVTQYLVRWDQFGPEC